MVGWNVGILPSELQSTQAISSLTCTISFSYVVFCRSWFIFSLAPSCISSVSMWRKLGFISCISGVLMWRKLGFGLSFWRGFRGWTAFLKQGFCFMSHDPDVCSFCLLYNSNTGSLWILLTLTEKAVKALSLKNQSNALNNHYLRDMHIHWTCKFNAIWHLVHQNVVPTNKKVNWMHVELDFLCRWKHSWLLVHSKRNLSFLSSVNELTHIKLRPRYLCNIVFTLALFNGHIKLKRRYGCRIVFTLALFYGQGC